eukprot:5040034-Prorocentrum_lima.AAC.1
MEVVRIVAVIVTMIPLLVEMISSWVVSLAHASVHPEDRCLAGVSVMVVRNPAMWRPALIA